jgi:hypothetical protein
MRDSSKQEEVVLGEVGTGNDDDDDDGNTVDEIVEACFDFNIDLLLQLELRLSLQLRLLPAVV